MKFAIAFTLALFASSAIAAPAPSPASIDPSKPAAVTLALQDWQAVLSSIGESTRVSARDANRISQAIVLQVQPQIGVPTAATKK